IKADDEYILRHVSDTAQNMFNFDLCLSFMSKYVFIFNFYGVKIMIFFNKPRFSTKFADFQFKLSFL
ncbi:MAG: hypothetical protein LBT50_06030, partial [Prevotellaceae bacterium]|nr:hypothetical protein [Prevotellaceae bacterium]